jgi:hypothetical protein
VIEKLPSASNWFVEMRVQLAAGKPRFVAART